MSLPNRTVADSSTDRAVMIAVAVLLPTVFGAFIVRHFWSAPRPIRNAEAAEAAAATAALPETAAPTTNLPAAHGRKNLATATGVQHPPLFSQTLTATAGDELATEFALQSAPPELSLGGRLIADPQAFAPTALTVRDETALQAELENVAQLDLYGVGDDSRRRFGEYRKDVAAERDKFRMKHRKLSEEARSGELGRRRLRTERGRREVKTEIATALFGTEDPFRPPFEPLKNWMRDRNDLQGLPLAMGDECRLDAAEAEKLQSVSTLFGDFRLKLSRLPDPTKKDELFLAWIHKQRWDYTHIPGLVQVMSAEDEPLRLDLVRLLDKFQYPAATTALARIAIFDLSAQVRWKAVIALRSREPEKYRQQLIAGLRYVWPPAADNAARALVSLDDQASYEYLTEMIDDPDPRAPYQTADGHWAVRELVGVNHMRNCQLCHAPAVTTNARVTGTVPSPYEPLPRVYYQNPVGNLVRADVTYLRQDFSVVHTIDDHKPWPERQRFDYLVRERKLNDKEAAELSQQFAHDLYPQRSALLYAIRKLRPDEDSLAARLAITSTD